jgi:hypothetical protein
MFEEVLHFSSVCIYLWVSFDEMAYHVNGQSRKLLYVLLHDIFQETPYFLTRSPL